LARTYIDWVNLFVLNMAAAGFVKVFVQHLHATDHFSNHIDPYVKIKYAGQEQRSSVRKNAGRKMDFNETFQFAYVPGHDMTFEVMDKDDKSDDHVGKSQGHKPEHEKGHHNLDLHHKGKKTGHLLVNIQAYQAVQVQKTIYENVAMEVMKQVPGPDEFKVTLLELHADHELFSNHIDPYVIVTYAGQEFQTSVRKNAGRKVHFGESFQFGFVSGNSIFFTVMDKDKKKDDYVGQSAGYMPEQQLAYEPDHNLDLHKEHHGHKVKTGHLRVVYEVVQTVENVMEIVMQQVPKTILETEMQLVNGGGFQQVPQTTVQMYAPAVQTMAAPAVQTVAAPLVADPVYLPPIQAPQPAPTVQTVAAPAVRTMAAPLIADPVYVERIQAPAPAPLLAPAVQTMVAPAVRTMGAPLIANPVYMETIQAPAPVQTMVASAVQTMAAPRYVETIQARAPATTTIAAPTYTMAAAPASLSVPIAALPVVAPVTTLATPQVTRRSLGRASFASTSVMSAPSPGFM
jgi:hypothetical protein